MDKLQKWMDSKSPRQLRMITTALLIVLFVVMCAVSFKAEAQTVYGTFAPEKLGTGIMYEFQVNQDAGIILSFDHGKYVHRKEGKPFKSTAEINKAGFGMRYNWFVALFQHHLSIETNDPNGWYDLSQIHKNSLELGALVFLGDRFSSGILYDVLNHEARLTVGINFKK